MLSSRILAVGVTICSLLAAFFATAALAQAVGVRVRSLTLVPDAVTGSGQSIVGVVSIDARAPVGGAKVALVSSDTIAAVPEYVLVPAGRTAERFAVTVQPVRSEIRVTLRAGGEGGKKAVLLVRPVSPRSVDVGDDPVRAREPVPVIVHLDAPAPEPTVVALSTDQAGAEIDRHAVEVSKGGTTAVFEVRFARVARATKCRLTAAANKIAHSTFVVVKP